jgi:hypothetical protein
LENLFQAKDYRAYLKRRFLELKAARKTFSITTLARKSGCSQSLIKKLFAHKVHLGVRYAEALAVALKLSEDEKQYLYFLAIYHSVSTSGIKDYLKFILVSLKDRGKRGIKVNNLPYQKKSFDREEYYTDFFTEVALELSRILGRPATMRDLEEHLPTLARTNVDLETPARQALALLKKQNPSAESPVFTPDPGNLSPFAASSMKGIEGAIGKLLEHHAHFHHLTPFTTFAAVTAVSKEDNDKILKILREARGKVEELSKSGKKTSRLLAVHIHGYSLSKP